MKRTLVAFVLVLAPSVSGAAEPLGQLFYTPAQRAQLDAARGQKARAVLEAQKTPSAPAPEVVTYDGVVRRSDGKTTVWINNRAVNDGQTPRDAPVTSRLRPDGSVSLGVAQSDRSVNLKVGQSVEIVSGTIAEPYSRPRGISKSADKAAGPPAPPGATAAPNNARPGPASRGDADEDSTDRR